ncbi:hypothetical protein Riv7116_4245 [Rivularia sp. PCC 7116]|nr:hypothetical protein Riv7116_4245 [Rivularia sp. PCC 7116]
MFGCGSTGYGITRTDLIQDSQARKLLLLSPEEIFINLLSANQIL